jgi:hypothetical protein
MVSTEGMHELHLSVLTDFGRAHQDTKMESDDDTKKAERQAAHPATAYYPVTFVDRLPLQRACYDRRDNGALTHSQYDGRLVGWNTFVTAICTALYSSFLPSCQRAIR